MNVLCHQCIHWEPSIGGMTINEEYPLLPLKDEYRDGRCYRLKDILDIDLHTGWDGGTVKAINTLASFGCVAGERA